MSVLKVLGWIALGAVVLVAGLIMLLAVLLALPALLFL